MNGSLNGNESSLNGSAHGLSPEPTNSLEAHGNGHIVDMQDVADALPPQVIQEDAWLCELACVVGLKPCWQASNTLQVASRPLHSVHCSSAGIVMCALAVHAAAWVCHHHAQLVARRTWRRLSCPARLRHCLQLLHSLACVERGAFGVVSSEIPALLAVAAHLPCATPGPYGQRQ